jgi:uncharacterized protein DUF4261
MCIRKECTLQQNLVFKPRSRRVGWVGPLQALAVIIVAIGQLGTAACADPAKKSLSKKVKDGGQKLAIVMLADQNWPDRAKLTAAINRRLPGGFKAESGNNAHPSTYVGFVDGRFVTLMFIDALNPLAPNESFIRAAWWWPDVRADLAKRKAHVIVSVRQKGDERADQLALARLVAAVMETSNAIGVIWDSADAVWPAKLFVSEIDAAKGKLPTMMAVSVKLGRDTQFPRPSGKPAVLGMTYGLRAFGLKEVEFRGFDGSSADLAKTLLGVAAYLMEKGDVIKDNDTMGEDLNRKFVINIVPSTLEAGKDVYRMKRVTDAPPAKPSNVHR